MLIDYHMHTSLCKHAVGTIEEYIKAGIEKGLHEIGFTDHMPMPSGYDPSYRMNLDEIDIYFDMVRNGRKVFPDITVKLGIEADYHPDQLQFVKSFLEKL